MYIDDILKEKKQQQQKNHWSKVHQNQQLYKVKDGNVVCISVHGFLIILSILMKWVSKYDEAWTSTYQFQLVTQPIVGN